MRFSPPTFLSFSLCYLSLSPVSLSLSSLSLRLLPSSLSLSLSLFSTPISPLYLSHTIYLSLPFSLLPDTYIFLSLHPLDSFSFCATTPVPHPPPFSISSHLIYVSASPAQSIYVLFFNLLRQCSSPPER